MKKDFLMLIQQPTYYDPLTQKPFNLVVDEANHSINITLNYCAKSKIPEYTQLLSPVCKQYYDNYQINWQIEIKAHATSNHIARIDKIKNIIAIVSGKGGVGKSTTAVNLAISLMQEGSINNHSIKVGVLDADIYGPSIPTLLGINGKPQIDENKNMLPIKAHGLVCNSIGLVVDNAPTIWRGPMATSAFNQLLNQTAWGEIDYLVIDMPPGTGDIQLTLAQKVPVTTAIIVTTPQTVATLDAQKGLEMLEKVNVNVGGIIENMSQHICSHCGHIENIFSGNGGEELAKKYNVPLLGKLPLNSHIGKYSDDGEPITISQPQHIASNIYREIAIKLTSQMSLLKKDTQSLFKVVVEK
jgi:ATP-binding protein involved in chromosome partitioning